MNNYPQYKIESSGPLLSSTVNLRLMGLWTNEGRNFARWSPLSRTLLSKTRRLLQDRLRPFLSPRCTHVKGRGGVKGTVRALVRQVGSYRFAARFDIASYYDSMQHHTLIELLNDIGVGKPLLNIVRQYLEIPDPGQTGKGMVAGGALSPLMGALYLTPLDNAMQRLISKGRIYYVRYMDDIVIMIRTRWHLRAAIRILIKVTQSLGLSLHKEKRYIGRVNNGFDFLGYQIQPGRKLRPSPESLKRLVVRARRLYEQGAGINRLWQYVTRWFRWLWGGLDSLISMKGGVKRYMVYILKQLQISGVRLPQGKALSRFRTGKAVNTPGSQFIMLNSRVLKKKFTIIINFYVHVFKRQTDVFI